MSTGGKRLWSIREEPSFTQSAALVGKPRYVDRALAAIYDALSHNPYGFPPTGVKGIRIARTRIVLFGREIIPALSVRFVVREPDIVSLLHVECSLPEEMEFDQAWPWS